MNKRLPQLLSATLIVIGILVGSVEQASARNPPPGDDFPVATTRPPARSTTSTLPVTTLRTPTTSLRSAERLASLKTKADEAVRTRFTALDNLTQEITDSKSVTPVHRSALLAEVAASKTGLTALNAQIQADNDLATAIADVRKIVTDYRVFALQVPKVHEILAIDGLLEISAKFALIEPRLDAQLAEKAKSSDVSAAQAAFADLKANSTAIDAAVAPLANAVLALQPSGYPDNRAVLQSTRSTVGDALKDAKAAREDVKTILAALQ